MKRQYLVSYICKEKNQTLSYGDVIIPKFKSIQALIKEVEKTAKSENTVILYIIKVPVA